MITLKTTISQVQFYKALRLFKWSKIYPKVWWIPCFRAKSVACLYLLEKFFNTSLFHMGRWNESKVVYFVYNIHTFTRHKLSHNKSVLYRNRNKIYFEINRTLFYQMQYWICGGLHRRYKNVKNNKAQICELEQGTEGKCYNGFRRVDKGKLP